jgi:hypothetical protein
VEERPRALRDRNGAESAHVDTRYRAGADAELEPVDGIKPAVNLRDRAVVNNEGEAQAYGQVPDVKRACTKRDCSIVVDPTFLNTLVEIDMFVPTALVRF